jgi:1-acyl-sn-glycerol-3-phosphate acyltransferase
VAQWLSIRLLALFGWRVVGQLPAAPRFVLIVAPHTSNWDFPIGVLAMFATGIQLNWLGKHTIFFFPASILLRWIGGEPVNRGTRAGIVETAIERFRTRPQYVFAVAPEGTRKRVEQWKTGFYRIAIGAGVPILTVAIDYPRRVVDLGTLYYPVGDEAEDLRQLRRRYRAEMARYPEQYVE